MSKRFGRNQRRRASEQIAALENEHGLLQVKSSFQEKSLNGAANRIYELEEQIRIAKACLGENHPAFPAGSFDPGFKPEPEDPLWVHGPKGTQMAATIMRFGTPRRDDYHGMVHYVLYAGSERVAYALSDHALKFVPRDVLAHRMTQELVELLLDNMKKEPRR